MKILFYKGPGLIDDLIRITGPYSHCEIQFKDICFSSSGRDGGVRFKDIAATKNYHKYWDYLEFNVAEKELFEWAKTQVGCRYDWPGLVGTCLGVPLESSSRWFCSEICSTICEAAGIYRGPKLITPSELYRCLNEANYNRN